MKKAELTKHQLINTLKELAQTMPFRKISVSHIADHAGMSRKSFYYHFKDKYDLVGYIFDTEFEAYCKTNPNQKQFEQLCHYLYEQREFYRAVLDYEGQNSFKEYLLCFIREQAVKEMPSPSEEDLAALALLSEGILAMLKVWLTNGEAMDADSFLWILRNTVDHLTQVNMKQK